ncbi:hypothetical protein [Ligilactobacillus ruminis]|jgi:hypothetical protein|nr:hypothetical protein [Ligilactobacillus ruminis]
MNELQRLAIEIANKTLKIAELETQVEKLNAEISALKSENEDKNTEK